MEMGKQPIHPNQEIILQLPSSEVCRQLRVAGTRMRARLEPNGMVQLPDQAARDFSFPITVPKPACTATRTADTAWPPTRRTRSPTSFPPTTSTERPWRRSANRWPPPIATAGEVRVIDGPAGLLYWHPELGYLSVPDPDRQP
jgi:hypothetical protein